MGHFNRESTGHKTDPVAVPVERGALTFFSETIGETNPVYSDKQAAQAAGHPDIPALPTYVAVLDMAAAKQMERAGLPDILTLIGADMRFLLHGSESYDFHAPIYAGETVTVSTHVTGFSDASNGKLEFAHLETEIRSPERGVLVSSRRDLIHRLL